MQSGNRGLIVGAFVIVGVAFIGWMAMSFKGGSGLAFFRRGYELAIVFTSIEGTGDGTEVRLNGKKIGQVARTEIDFAALQPPRLICEIQQGYRVPKDSKPRLMSEAFGRKYVDIVFHPPADGQVEYWPSDGTAVVPGIVQASVYDQVGDAVEQVGRTVRALESKSAQTLERATEVLAGMSKVIEENRRGVQLSIDSFSRLIGSEDNQKNVSKTLAFFGDEKLHADVRESVAGFRRIAGDPKLAEDVKAAATDLRASAADIREVTKKAKDWTVGVDRIVEKVEKTVDGFDRTVGDIGASVTRVAFKLQDDLERLERILRPLEVVARDIQEGKGTVGRLLTDHRLYEAMVDLTTLMKMTGEDVRKLVKKWSEGGLHLKGGIFGG